MARPPLGKLNFRLPDSLRDRAQAIADRDNVSLNSVLLKALENYVPFRERQHQDQDKKAQKRLQQRVPRTPDALLAPVFPRWVRNSVVRAALACSTSVATG